MQKKKVGILLCTALLTLSIVAGPAAALEVQSVAAKDSYTETLVDPRFTNISRISSGLTINSLGRAACTGSTTLYFEHDCTITMVICFFAQVMI